MMSKTQALEKLMEMYPDEFVTAETFESLKRHPGYPVESDHQCIIYIADIGHKNGSSFEDCFKQL